MKKTNEAFFWSLFSAGGVMAALFLPALIVVTGFIVPFGGGDEGAAALEPVHRLASMWLVRIALLGVITLAAIHAAHRIRHILMDLGLRHGGGVLMAGCYGAALLLSAVAAMVLLQL